MTVKEFVKRMRNALALRQIRRRMTAKEFVNRAHEHLSLIENKDGEVIYSRAETFTKGKYYFLGLNPGGDGFITIKDDLNKFENKTTNAFYDDTWNTEFRKYEKGKNPLQKRVQWLFEDCFDYDLKKVFATNLIFTTTRDAESLNFGLAGICWNVHLDALSVVQPEIILTCGNEEGKSAFYFIANLYAHETDIKKYELDKTHSIKTAKVVIQNRTSMLIGLPHLSRFNPIDNEKFLETMREVIR